MVKHTRFLYVRPAFLRLRRPASSPAVLPFALVCDLSLLKRRVFPIASRLAPRPVMRHARRPPCALIKLCSFRSSPSALARPRFSPIGPPLSDAPPNRHARRGEERGEDGCLAGSCYMISCGVIYSAFLLYISCSCYISRVLVIYLVFLLYISYSCYISRIFVICPAFLLYARHSCYISHPILCAVQLPALSRLRFELIKTARADNPSGTTSGTKNGPPHAQ